MDEMRRAAANIETFRRFCASEPVLEDVRPSAELHVHLEELTYIDHACLDLLESWTRQHESLGGTVQIDWRLLHARYRQAPQVASAPEPALRPQPVRATGVAR